MKEGHVNRQVNSRQEKLAKMQIQHKVEVEGLKENIAARERYEKCLHPDLQQLSLDVLCVIPWLCTNV